jgi:P-type Cu2+ transporter
VSAEHDHSHDRAAPGASAPRHARGVGAHGGYQGYDQHAGHSAAMFRDEFWVSLALTIPTLVWGHMLQSALGYTAPSFPGSRWIPAVFGTAVFVYGARPFIKGAGRELANRLPGMMTLIALGISVAFAFSAAVTLGFPGMPLWEELTTLVTIMLLGHWMQMRALSQAEGALAELAKLLPDTATRISAGGMEEVPLSELREGDVVLVRPGASIPADGTVREGRSTVNESVLTGESRPVTRAEGDEVIAGSVNGEGSLRVVVTSTGERTALAGIMRLVAQAQESRSRAQDLADRAAFLLTVVAVAAAVATAIAWGVAGSAASFIVERVVTVLVIACPHALGLAIPLVIAISTTLGARNGLLVHDRRGLEEARNLSTIVFDKTGTLTLGEHRVVAMETAPGLEAEATLRLAAAVEQDSEHPVARAIVQSAADRGIRPPSSTNFSAIPGQGVQADVDGRRLAVGGPNFLRALRAEPAPELRTLAEDAARDGSGVVYLVEDHRALAAFAVADAVRPESRDAVRRLHDLGADVVMLTGDSRAVAESVARELGIDTVFAEVLPGEKAAKVKELQSAGRRVGMVGDGVNDAPALVTADVGIAIGAGTDVAVEAGDVVLVRSDPRDVPRIIVLSRATYRKSVQNLWIAAGYNIVAIPLAAGVLAARGIVLSPAIGAALMSLSTIGVAINAQLLRRTRL